MDDTKNYFLLGMKMSLILIVASIGMTSVYSETVVNNEVKDNMASNISVNVKLPRFPDQIPDSIQKVILPTGTPPGDSQELAEVPESFPDIPGYQFDNITGKCYKAHLKPINWVQAMMLCLLEGAHLLIINSYAEIDVMKRIHSDNQIQTNYVNVGIFRKQDTRDFRTIIYDQTLEEAGYAQWADGKPDRGNQFCGMIDKRGLYDDTCCECLDIATICEKKPSGSKC